MITYPNTYEEAIIKLRENSLYPTRVISDNECVELEVYCISFLMGDRMEKIKKILGGGWKVDRIPNYEYISIKK